MAAVTPVRTFDWRVDAKRAIERAPSESEGLHAARQALRTHRLDTSWTALANGRKRAIQPQP